MIRTAFALLALTTWPRTMFRGALGSQTRAPESYAPSQTMCRSLTLSALRRWCRFARRVMHLRCRELGRIFFMM